MPVSRQSLKPDVAVIAAKADPALPYGQFEAMVKEDLRFNPSTARRLMIIARDRKLGNRAHGHDLPPSWRTLYELTKLSGEEFQTLLDAGTIRPDVQREEIVAKRKALARDGGASRRASVLYDQEKKAIGARGAPIVRSDEATPQTLADHGITNGRQCCEIRLRAEREGERRGGELLEEIPPDSGGRPAKNSGRHRPEFNRTQAATEGGLSERQRKTASPMFRTTNSNDWWRAITRRVEQTRTLGTVPTLKF